MRILLFTLLILCLPAPHARADESCQAEYERGADRYWTIIADIMQFKAVFDDYDRLCQLHYPDEIKALQPAADLLRAQTDRDIRNTKKAMTYIFDEILPRAVPATCMEDDSARNTVKKKFLAGMAQKSKMLELRMKKSAKTLQSPKESLTLCQQLKPLKPKIEKALGPGLENPLLEMSVLNRAFTKKPKHDKKALQTYRETLKGLPAED